ncbi:hypothetical protein MRX96_021042 [Rhipicephalus microplus]
MEVTANGRDADQEELESSDWVTKVSKRVPEHQEGQQRERDGATRAASTSSGCGNEGRTVPVGFNGDKPVVSGTPSYKAVGKKLAERSVASHLPRLPNMDHKVIIRPKEGLTFTRCSAPVIGGAMAWSAKVLPHKLKLLSYPHQEKATRSLGEADDLQKPFSTPATPYGLRNEPKARKALEQKLQTPILETGLVVLPEQPWLACSPDGLMRYEGNTVLVKIKCPARCEKVPIIDKEGKMILEFFDCQAGTLTLKKSHSFYTQLQLQLYIMNLSQAVFYAWSTVQDDKFLFGLVAVTLP